MSAGGNAIWRKQLAYRAQHRGIKEMDLLMGRFVAEHLDVLDEAELAQFEALLEMPDQDIYGWVAGSAAAPGEHDNTILARLRAYRFGPDDFS